MFDDLLKELNISILEHGGCKLSVPNDFQECVSETRNCSIKSWLWDVPKFRRWRVTRLDAGDRLQVLNTVAYPEYKADLPILGVDLLWFGKKEKLVAILDFQPLIQDQEYFDRYFEGLKYLKEYFRDFNSDTNMNLYDPNKYFSPWVLFCKGGINEATNLLPSVFTAFIKSYWKNFNLSKGNYKKIGPIQVKRIHIDYDKYSAEKDPAHGLFSGFFGKEWSDKYMKEFLFPLSSEKCNSL